MGNYFDRCFGGNSERNDEENLFENNSERYSEGFIFRLLKHRPKRNSSFLSEFWNKKNLLYARLNRRTDKTSSSNINLQCLDARSLMMLARDGDFAYRQELNSECTSNYSNSLDLEWEHEYDQQNEWLLPTKEEEEPEDASEACSEPSNKSSKNRRNLITRVDNNLKVYLNTGSPCQDNSSRRSTPDSLEWDRDELIKSEIGSVGSLDYETKELLNEIEQLKNRVLSETGDGVIES